MPKKLLALIFGINLATVFAFWYSTSGSTLSFPLLSASNLIIFGRLFGLLTVLFTFLQILLIGRIRWIESYFGLDKLAHIHSLNGRVVLTFLLFHFFLINLGYGQISNRHLLAQVLDFIQNYPSVLNAFLGFCLFLVIAVISIFFRKRLRYEFWYLTHLFVYGAVLLAFTHQIEMGADLLINPSFKTYWLTLYVFVFGNLLLYRFVRPVYLFVKHDFRVDKVIPETTSATSVYITGKNIDQFKRTAGQFFFFYFLTPSLFWEKHPFSLSCGPSESYLRITPKAVGDFTSKIPNIPPGTKVVIDGPYGVFTPKAASKNKFLFIAGGIGITPIESMIHDLVPKGKDVLLLYSNKTKKDIVFLYEIDELSIRYKNFKAIHSLTEDKKWTGEKGRLDQEKILRLAPDYKNREIYLCGPKEMVIDLRKLFHTLDVNPNQIHFEVFEL